MSISRPYRGLSTALSLPGRALTVDRIRVFAAQSRPRTVRRRHGSTAQRKPGYPVAQAWPTGAAREPAPAGPLGRLAPHPPDNEHTGAVSIYVKDSWPAPVSGSGLVHIYEPTRPY